MKDLLKRDIQILLAITIYSTADFDYAQTTVMLTFVPTDEGTQTMCFNVTIIDDSLGNEPDEQFSVTITDAVPAGSVDSEACVTIVDNDSESKLIELLNIT